MLVLRAHHQNHCLRCPIVRGAELRDEDLVGVGPLRFNLKAAKSLCRDSMLHRVDRNALAAWLTSVPILPDHLDHLPAGLGPGIMATLPNGLGQPLIDGNHRAARALREGSEFLAYVPARFEDPEALDSQYGSRRSEPALESSARFHSTLRNGQQGEQR